MLAVAGADGGETAASSGDLAVWGSGVFSADPSGAFSGAAGWVSAPPCAPRGEIPRNRAPDSTRLKTRADRPPVGRIRTSGERFRRELHPRRKPALHGGSALGTGYLKV